MHGGKGGAQFSSGLQAEEVRTFTRNKITEKYPGKGEEQLQISEKIEMAKETANEMETSEPRYKFKNVLMVSSCWSEKILIMTMVEKAKEYGTKFYATYSSCDTEGTTEFTDEYMKDYLSAEPWHLDATAWHAHTRWDIGTYDSDGNGRADIWETMFGNDD